MLWSSLTVLALISSMQAAGPNPPSEASPRILVIGASVIRGIDQDGVVDVLEDATIVIENGRVSEVGPRIKFQLREDDIAVTARDRFAVAAPIIFSSDEAWFRGGSLLSAAVSGVGHIAMPEASTKTPAGRCAVFRAEAREFPAAFPVAASEGASSKVVTAKASDPGREGVTLDMRLFETIARRRAVGATNTDILAAFTTAAAQHLGREDLGVIRPGSVAMILVTNADPRTDPGTMFDPRSFVMGDRVMRRAEIEVLRETIARSREQRALARALEPPEEGGVVTRYVVSVAAQIFGGAAIRLGSETVTFATKQGAPRNDAVRGVLRHDGTVGAIAYQGPPESFRFRATAVEGGLSIELEIEGRELVTAASPGATTSPLMELAADIAIRASALAKGTHEFDVQELIYGNGPIGLGPRRLRFTPISAEACPPCFEAQGDVWQLEVLAVDQAEPTSRFKVFVAFRDGVPSRIRIDTPYGASWYDRLDAKISLD